MSVPHWQTAPLILPALQVSTVHLWRANLDQANFPISLLSVDESHRASRFSFSIHQQRFAAARNILRCILARYLNQPPQSIAFQYNAYGKPGLTASRLAALPSPIYFNLSHSHQWAVYAIGLEEKIGVDVEYTHKELAALEIAQRFFSTNENQQLAQLPANQQLAAFFKLWTCKEAFIKAVGAGLSFPLQEFDVDILNKPPRLLSVRGDLKQAQPWSLRQFSLAADYAAALAVKTPIDAVEYWQFMV